MQCRLQTKDHCHNKEPTTNNLVIAVVNDLTHEGSEAMFQATTACLIHKVHLAISPSK